MMEKKLINKLISLIQLDVDAVNAYEEAIQRIDDDDIRDEMKKFQADYRRHIAQLSVVVTDLGGQPPELGRDVRGYLLEAMTAVMSAVGTKPALRALHACAKIVSRTYHDAVTVDLPPRITSVVKRHAEDEERHLARIEQLLGDKASSRTAS